MLSELIRLGLRPGAIAFVALGASACLPLCNAPEGCELGLASADEFPAARHAAVFTERGVSVTRMDVTSRTEGACVLVLGLSHPGEEALVRETTHDLCRVSPTHVHVRDDNEEMVHVLLIGPDADGQIRGVGFPDLADAERGMEALRGMASACTVERRAGPIGGDEA